MSHWAEALLSGAGVLFIVFLAWIVQKLSAHDVALAVLIQQVNPPGDKSLREILHDIQIEQARTQGSNTRTEAV